MRKLISVLLILTLLLWLPCSVLATEPSAEASEPSAAAEATESARAPEPEASSEEATEPEASTEEATEPEASSEEATEPETSSEPEESTAPAEPFLRLQHSPYLRGYADGSFRPNAALTRAQAAQIFCTLSDYPAGERCFADVRPGDWFEKAVNAATKAGLFQGDGGLYFFPHRPITRAELTAVLFRHSGQSASGSVAFSDVSPKHWAYSAIGAAQAQGWITGYPDGSFRPDQAVTRAEAVTIFNRYLDREADHAAIEAGAAVRFFPDVLPGSWYYDSVMEATVSHAACFEREDGPELWQDAAAASAGLKNGYYLIDGKLYAAVDGDLVHREQSGVLNGVNYRCSGADGVCTAETEVLTLVSGELIFLSGGKPSGTPGRYSAGFHVKGGQLYVVENGRILRQACSGTVRKISYHCKGKSGVCTTPDWTKLKLTGVNLSCFSSALTPEAAKPGSGNLTLAGLLRALVRVYEVYFHVEYPLADDAAESELVNRALAYGILSKKQSSYGGSVSRGEAADYLCRALHGRELEAVNEVAALPDLSESDAHYASVMTLYRTGVMGGIGSARNVQADDLLTKQELGQLLTRLERREERLRFTLSAKTVVEIRYGTSGSGKYALKAYQIGNGKNVMILTFAIHGWEDHWARDGQSLVYLGNQTKAWLEKNYALVSGGDWTVYVLPCLNPDGVNLGTTNNGPGRCTTKSYNSSGQLISRGIDMNRCFPYHYVRFSDDRNYNGTAPLQCAEAKALASFVQSHKGSGYNVCIDTHGWTGQIICTAGKGTVYQALHEQFPSNVYTYMGKGNGYFSAWAGFTLGFDACLMELPTNIYSHSAFLSSGCVGKFQNAIKYLLQHYNGKFATRNPADYLAVELDGN